MKRRSKIIATITTMCLALSMLVVGVLAASTVTFDITGTVSYIVEDVYVEFEARVYSSSKRFTSDDELKTSAQSLESSNFDDINAMANLDGDTFNKVQIKNTSSPSTWSANNTDYYDTYSSLEGGEHSPLGLTLNYSSNPTKILTYFVIVKVKNLSSAPLYAYIPLSGDNKLAMPGNSLLYNTGSYVTIENQNESKYIVFAFSIDDMSKELETTACNFPVQVTIDKLTIPDVYPALAMNNVVYVPTEKELSTSPDAPSTTILNLENNSLIGDYAGIEFEIPESSMSLYTTSEYIDIYFTLMLTNIPESLGIGERMSFYQMYAMDSSELTPQMLLEEMILPSLIVSSKSTAETTSASDLITAEQGLIVSIEADTNNLETYTISIPKSALVNGNKFSIGFYGELAEMLAQLESVGGKLEITNFWASTKLNFLGKVAEGGCQRYEIGNSTFTYSGVLSTTESLSYASLAFSFQVIDVPSNKESINLTLSSPANFMYFVCPGQLSLNEIGLFHFMYDSVAIAIELNTTHVTQDMKIPENWGYYTVVVMLENADAVGMTLPVTVSSNYGAKLELIGYELSDNGEYYIVNGNTPAGRDETKLEIPSTYKGLPVKEIARNAFNPTETITNVEEIILPEGLEVIQHHAFYASKLKKIEFPSTLKTIEHSAFMEANLQEISIGSNVEHIGADALSISKDNLILENGVYYLYSRNRDAKYVMSVDENYEGEINLDETVKAIAEGSFVNASKVKSLTIPSTIKYLGTGEFSNMAAVTQLNFNADLDLENSYSDVFGSTFGQNGFNLVIGKENDTTKIDIPNHFFSYGKVLTVEIKNNVNSIGDNVFYATTLSGEVIIPDSVVSIGASAFQGANITKLVLGNSLKTIKRYAFSFIDSIEEVIIPDSVTTIGEYAFGYWTSSQSIYFEGTSMPENLDTNWNKSSYAKIYLNGEIWNG